MKHLSVTALMIARGDDWSIEYAIRRWAPYVDRFCVVIDDRTPCDPVNAATVAAVNRIASNASPFISIVYTRLVTPEAAWDEMNVRQCSLRLGRQHQALAALSGDTRARDPHAVYVIADADEYPFGVEPEQFRRRCDQLAIGESFSLPMLAPWYEHRGTWCRTDGVFGCAKITVAFRDAPHIKWANAGDGYRYHARPPKGTAEGDPGPGQLVHLQFASLRRLAAKAAWYKVTERLAHGYRETAERLNEKYDWALRLGEHELAPTPPGVFDRTPGLDLDADPWQLAELRRLLPTVPAHLLERLDLHEEILGPHR